MNTKLYVGNLAFDTTENDLRDMQSFCAVLAHADIVVAEKLFSNLATQAGLDKKYGTTIKPDLYSLPALVAAA